MAGELIAGCVRCGSGSLCRRSTVHSSLLELIRNGSVGRLGRGIRGGRRRRRPAGELVERGCGKCPPIPRRSACAAATNGRKVKGIDSSTSSCCCCGRGRCALRFTRLLSQTVAFAAEQCPHGRRQLVRAVDEVVLLVAGIIADIDTIQRWVVRHVARIRHVAPIAAGHRSIRSNLVIFWPEQWLHPWRFRLLLLFALQINDASRNGERKSKELDTKQVKIQ